MNPIQELIINFQELAAQIPEAIRPFIVMLAGAIPFIEGEVAAIIGLVGGLNPIVAGIAAAAGNFLCVLAVVLVTSRARTAVVNHNRDRAEATRNATLVPAAPGYQGATAVEAPASAKPQSKGRQRFAKWLVRFGVPGASILGPLAIPTQFTSAILIASGTPRGWVLLWQGVAIVLWTTVSIVSVWAALTFVVGV
ncbi:small multidrug efflux protein [Arthrobacter sp. ATA002]|uniref:small multidrug efflux protein n=1 Tax=Arthrobacter sp. ATA002 TaxID=2991715 RepID=UPI0022A7520A|nr:small multidrug efflux protein [Arthrobacter sp. ATA002]WAP50954.1 small multidrug efflux protein [Arthrobacter sp. ATA002]